ncbi:MAG: DUF371 domain-containing protein [Euryarchaeota archaeon]|jgi:hypothetical protein|uniref:DUF371 domain-containing protein n=1 Tax=Methanobacterium sp. MZD130B TaxID=3394378 RepID=UPI001767073A|nr:DUF371 domain-containing protein [Euryarchaeota archaeon]HHT19330.1 DUF371 domain-containing protein [Methanobacterium sp.]
MKFSFEAKGHPNVTSQHRSTFEVTQEKEIRLAADCIVGVASKVSLNDMPSQMKEAIRDEKTHIKVILETENSEDEITGYGHPSLTLDHPTDMVCRKSSYTCNRTLMINANKAAVDLNQQLVDDLKSGKKLTVKIIVD